MCNARPLRYHEKADLTNLPSFLLQDFEQFLKICLTSTKYLSNLHQLFAQCETIMWKLSNMFAKSLRYYKTRFWNLKRRPFLLTANIPLQMFVQILKCMNQVFSTNSTTTPDNTIKQLKIKRYLFLKISSTYDNADRKPHLCQFVPNAIFKMYTSSSHSPLKGKVQ